MRILMISDVYFPRVNGVSTSIQTFRRGLATLGHEVDLIAPAYPARYAEYRHTLRVASRFIPLDPEDRMMKPGNVRALSRHFSRTQCNRMNALIVPSSAMRDKLAEYGVRAPMHVIPTGIPMADLSGGDGAAFRARHGIGTDRPMLLFVGRVAHEKNIDFLLRALEQALVHIPGLLLTIAGEGPALVSLRKLAVKRNLQDHVLFVGYLDRRAALLDCYRSADAFVFASRTETQGLVLLEAMALGVPVISTAVMGTRDVVGPGRGALVPEDNEADFARNIVKLMNDAALRAGLGVEGRVYAAEWNAGTLAGRLADAYREVIGTNGRISSELGRQAGNAVSPQVVNR